MTPDELRRRLNSIRDRMQRILAGNAGQILDEAAEQVRVRAEAAKKRYRASRRSNPTWGFAISPDRPLEFQEVVSKGLKFRVDLFCDLAWSHPSGTLTSPRNLVVRVWSREESLVFRPEWDSEHVIDRIQEHRGRVMVRYHFDLANEGQEGPKHHIQTGGGTSGHEVCWFVESVDLPRIPHPPLDLLLACEMVAANFFPAEYRQIRRDPTWVGSLRLAQANCYHEYFQQCSRTITDNESLLSSLWNVAT